MRVLELFSGTGSVSKVCKLLDFPCVSLDLKGADINCDILTWNYKESYNPGDFNIIWASPPCTTFSKLQILNLGRRHSKMTMDDILERRITEGVPPLMKTIEIIEYFKPKFYFIENPSTGFMQLYMPESYKDQFYDVDYCQYSDWGYQKPTRVWTNLIDFAPKRCDLRTCLNLIPPNKEVPEIRRHKRRIGKALGLDKNVRQGESYRIPPDLINNLFLCCLEESE